MNAPATRISILIPTLNSGRTLRPCLDAIREQDYPAEAVEIVIADAGSTDDTIDIARECGVTRIVPNGLKTGEAGKSAAAAAADGDILALIDSDNILPGPDWLARMVAPFADPDVAASEPLHYTRRVDDGDLTRYFAMLGMTDPLCLFIGNYDRYTAITGKWTEIPLETVDQGDWIKVALQSGAPMPTIGANGFLIRRNVLDAVAWRPYWFDVDVLRDVAAAAPDGRVHMAKVKCGIVHLYCQTFAEFARKQKRRVRDFLYFSPVRERAVVPAERKRLVSGIIKFSLSTITVVPLLIQRIRGNRRTPDPAWSLHVPACFVTLWIYGTAFIGKCFGARQAPLSRENWRQ
ncbi:MAG: glycosyltransferase [Kiritimatiellia bacterium]|jgi:glycosyltransferase involved in cell wall biosynthesis